MRRISAFLTVMMALCYLTVFAQEIVYLHIGEVNDDKSEMKVYFNIFNQENQEVIETIDENNIKLMIDGLSYEEGKLSRVREDLPLRCLFLVDISTSMTKKQMTSIRKLMHDWNIDSGLTDQIGILTFGDQVYVHQGFSSDKALIENSINQIDSKDDTTAFYDGIDKGIHMIQQDNSDFEGRTIMVVFSDAEDVDAGGKTYEEVKDSLMSFGIPLYGYGTVTHPDAQDQVHLDAFASLSRESGGVYHQQSELDFESFHYALKGLLQNQYVYSFIQDRFQTDYSVHELTVIIETDDYTITDKQQYISDSAAVNVKQTDTTKAVDTIRESDSVKDQSVQSDKSKDSLSDNDVGEKVIEKGQNSESEQIPDRELEAEKDEVKSGKESFIQTVSSFFSSKAGLIITAAVAIVLITGFVVLIVLRRRGKGLQVALTYKDPSSNKAAVLRTNLLKGSITVGRSEENRLEVADGEMSRVHFQLFFANGHIYIQDMESSNGTYLNGHGLADVMVLNDQDHIKAGNTIFAVSIDV